MMSGTLHKVNKVVDKAYMILAGVLFIVLIGASFVQVVTRYLFNSSMVGTEELARYCYIWMSLLGGSIAVGRWAHTAITVVYDMVPRIPKKIMFIFQNVCVILLAVIFIFGGIKMIQVTGNQTTPTLHLSKALIYWSVPLAGAGMILHAIENIIYAFENFGSEETGVLTDKEGVKE